MRTHARILMVLCLFQLHPDDLKAQSPRSVEEVRYCLALSEQLNAARAARDWTYVERLAARYLDDCRGISESPFFENESFAVISEAQAALGRYDEAMETAERCIEFEYRAWQCHMGDT